MRSLNIYCMNSSKLFVYLALFVIHKPFSFIRDKRKLNSTRKRKKGKHKGDLSQ